MAGETSNTAQPLNNGATPAPIPPAADPDAITADAEISLDETGEGTIEEAGAEEAPAAAAPAAEAPKPKFKPKENTDAILGRKSYEARHYKNAAEQIAAEKAALEERLHATEARASHIDQSALRVAERAAKAELELGKREYADAVAVNDVTKISAAAERIAQATNDLNGINTVKAQIQPAAPAPVQQPAQQVVQPAAQPQALPQPLANWLTENPWAVPNNDHYDQDMAGFLAGAAQTVESRYHRQGKAAEIGSPAYFADLDNAMRAEFPDRFEGAPAPARAPKPQVKPAAPKMTKPAASVAPGGTTPAPAANGATPGKVTLTAEERTLAIRMGQNGAIQFPYGHPKYGQRPDDNESQILFAKAKLGETAKQAQRGR